MCQFVPKGLGWHQDLPDFRDYTPDSSVVVELFSKFGSTTARVPRRVDLRAFFPQVKQQGDLPASAAFACVDLIEYFQRRSTGECDEPSVLFLHQAAKRAGAAMHLSGVDLRSHLRSIVTFGIPPARHWPNDPSNTRRRPDASLYAFAERYRHLRYVRLDPRNSARNEVLCNVKSFLAAGFPSVFGFAVPSSLTSSSDIPYRPTFDFVRGGQALVAVGFDDDHVRGTRGALLVRSSWGRSWGEEGYGWLPYAYVEQRIACCFWTMVNPNWLQSDEFGCPEIVIPSADTNRPDERQSRWFEADS